MSCSSTVANAFSNHCHNFSSPSSFNEQLQSHLQPNSKILQLLKNASVTTLPIFKNLYFQNIFKNLYSQIHYSYHKFFKNDGNPPLHSDINHYKIHNFSIDTNLQSDRQLGKQILKKLGKIYLTRTNTFATKVAFHRNFKIL